MKHADLSIEWAWEMVRNTQEHLGPIDCELQLTGDAQRRSTVLRLVQDATQKYLGKNATIRAVPDTEHTFRIICAGKDKADTHVPVVEGDFNPPQAEPEVIVATKPPAVRLLKKPKARKTINIAGLADFLGGGAEASEFGDS